MATCGPRAAVNPPFRPPSRIGLVAAARELGQGRPMVGGVEFDYEAGAAAVGSVDPYADHTKSITESADTVQWDPFLIWTGEACSTFGGSQEESFETARLRLIRQTSHKVEEVVWTNLVDGTAYNTGSAHPNIGLANSGATQLNSGTATGIVTAFSNMIMALADDLGSERGMIHVDARLLPFLSFYGLVVREGNLLLTALADHIVVAGTGYTGSAPDAPETPLTSTTSWIYGTGIVELALSDVYGTQYTDPETNTVEARAERAVLASWDTNTHYAALACIPDPGPVCP